MDYAIPAETAADHAAVREVHSLAFGDPARVPVALRRMSVAGMHRRSPM
ncbi:hypothetical protein AB0B31_38540 [Catellatospora citrea]